MTCPDDCSGQGTCDGSTGTCTCNTGFTGANCAGKKEFYKMILFSIANHNITLIPLPKTLFYHKDRTCPDDCSGQGTCDASTGTCTCNTGFTGANCAGKEKKNHRKLLFKRCVL